MSETDDTDVLLLIPPDFFFVKSSGSDDSLLESSRTVVHKPISSTAQVLDKLVNQVQTLETRLDSLEISSEVSTLRSLSGNNKTWNSTDSFDAHSVDRKYFTFPRRRRRKLIKRDKQRDLSLTSLDSASTFGKAVPRLKLDEGLNVCTKVVASIDLQSMDGDISSIVSTPSKKNDKLLLHEIDEFLTKVEAYESPETRYKGQDSNINPDNVIKATGEYISSKLSKNDDIKLPSGRTISGNVLDKYIYLVKNNNLVPQEKPSPPDNKTLESHTKTLDQSKVLGKDEDSKSPSVRRLNFEKDVQPTSTPKKPQSCVDTFRPTSNKVLDRASKVLEQYKAQNCSRNTQQSVSDSYTMSPKREFKLPQMKPFSENKESMKFLQNKYIDSIDTDLLSLSDLWGENREKGDRIEGLKLEEERLKREHCEAMIQQLQRKILEQQEKLAVAVKVDRAKDAAIAKLREAWLKLTGSLDKAEERHRNALEKMMREVDNFRAVADDAQKKTNHFEAELYKALDLAHDYQEKYKLLASEKKVFEESMEKALAANNEIISSKDKEIQVLKENYDTVMRLNKQSTDCVKNLEEALEKEKSSHEGSRQKGNELYGKVQSLTENMTLMMQERDLLKGKVNEERGRCNILEQQLADKVNQCSELVKKCDFLDNEAKNLRKYMDLQKSELKTHYQKQLEDAVLSKLQEFQQQLELAERGLETEARTKENAIVDSFNKQILRIEDQHKLEVNVLEEKQREEIKLYRLQLAQASEKIGLLESKLESYRRRRGELASQLHGVMQAQWHQALRILTNGHHETAASTPLPFMSDLSLSRRQLSAPPPPPPPPRPAPPPPPPPPPAAGAQPAVHRDLLTDTELHHYVKMLLSKPPNFDGSGDSLPLDPHRECNEEPTSDRPAHDRRDKAKRTPTNKPPWKS